MDCLLIAWISLALLCTFASSSERKTKREVNSPSIEEFAQNAQYFLYQQSSFPKDCYEAQGQCSTRNSSGVYVIKPDGFPEPFEVFCNHNIDKGGWTVILRRENNSVNFNRSWSEYKAGFGFLATEFWLGNDQLSYLTNQGVYELRLDLQLSTGARFYTVYKGFRIADEVGQYKLSFIGTFEGNVVTSSCPTNMKYGTCSCQTTCEDPNGESGCHDTCAGDEGCVCPEGFYLNGTDCILDSHCGCFLTEEGIVIASGETFVNDDCTRRCTCSNDQLACVDISCSAHATCVMSNGVRECVCGNGYEGDGYTACRALYTDCKDVYDAGNTQDGVYTILPLGWTDGPFRVYCKMDNGGGWTMFQKRTDSSTNFDRSWNEYKNGFGDLVDFNNDFWLGNDKLFYLTNQRNYKLRFDIITSSGSSKYAEYTEFQIESETTNYRMNKLGTRSGNTGNSLYTSRGKQFSTRGRDNDGCGNFHCAEKHRSGWWHSDNWCSTCHGNNCHRFHRSGSCYIICTDDNLNGDYDGGNGQRIYSYGGGPDNMVECNLRYVEMKIRPSS